MVPISPKPIAHFWNLKGHLRNHGNMAAISFRFMTVLLVKPRAAWTISYTVSGGALSVPTDYILLKPVVSFDIGLGFAGPHAEWSLGSLYFLSSVMNRRLEP
jgi:hypothetical protein